MPNGDNLYNEQIVDYFIDNPVVTCSDSVTISAFEFFATLRPWFYCQMEYGLFNCRIKRFLYFFQFFEGLPAKR